ncbi:hypothetical protein U9M48_010781 [Paspalum notatum var. saurae]|uniref:Uncharacterized protein n=1 Tax=Paspalum notatum var. saurae TaxID=547442 RepID=A0AAQ3SVR5_PASNO
MARHHVAAAPPRRPNHPPPLLRHPPVPRPPRLRSLTRGARGRVAPTGLRRGGADADLHSRTQHIFSPPPWRCE